MTDVQRQVDRLKQQIDTGAEETKLYLDKLKKKVEEYDSQYKLSETASSYLQSGIDTASSSVDELKHVGSQLEKQSKSASDETIQTAQHALGKVKDSLDGLQHKAREYDRKFAGSTGSSVASGIESIVNSARQRTTDTIEMANEQAMRVMELIQNAAGSAAQSTKEEASSVAASAQHATSGVTHKIKVATGEAVKAAEVVDEKLGVTPKVSSVVSSVTETVKNLDQRMHVTETAVKIDSKITGGLATNLVHKGVEMVQESIEYVTEALHQAKIAANKSPTAQMADDRAAGAAQQVSDNTGAMQDEAMQAKDQATGLAATAAEEVSFMASSAKDQVMDAASSAKDKAMDVMGMNGGGPSMVDQTKSMAEQAGDMASDRMQQAKEGAQGMAGKAMEKGQDMKEGAKQTGSHAMQMGYDMKEVAKEKGSQAMEKGSEMTGAGGSSGSSSSWPSSRSSGSSSNWPSSRSGGVMESMKDRATELGTAAKEATKGMSSGDWATAVRHNQQPQHQQQQQWSTGNTGYTQQVPKSATQSSEQAKDMSRQRAMMMDSTWA